MRRLISLLLAGGLLAATGSALADRLPLPADTPKAYRDECGSCHLAFPPSLLAAADWQRVLAGLDKHFGSDARLDKVDQLAIGNFLQRHAGEASRLGGAGDPPRLTRTARFQRKHHEVPAALWRDARVKSAANCEACHRQAAAGSFSEHDLALPELRRER